jgi:hypothetical protein
LGGSALCHPPPRDNAAPEKSITLSGKNRSARLNFRDMLPIIAVALFAGIVGKNANAPSGSAQTSEAL